MEGRLKIASSVLVWVANLSESAVFLSCSFVWVGISFRLDTFIRNNSFKLNQT